MNVAQRRCIYGCMRAVAALPLILALGCATSSGAGGGANPDGGAGTGGGGGTSPIDAGFDDCKSLAAPNSYIGCEYWPTVTSNAP